MINSRDPYDLRPEMIQLWLELRNKCAEVRIDLILTSTYRDNESQNELYAAGRTKPGKIVTNAKGGQSFHNHRAAFDVVPIVNGKAEWSNIATWKRISSIGKSLGLVSGADFSIRDYPHFQLPGRIVDGNFQK